MKVYFCIAERSLSYAKIVPASAMKVLLLYCRVQSILCKDSKKDDMLLIISLF